MPPEPTTSEGALHCHFLLVLAHIQLHARISFRYIRCPHRREDAVAETVALSWKWFRRLVKRGKDPLKFPSALATFAAKAVKSGRRLTGMEKPKDVLSPRSQHLHDFGVGKLPDFSTLGSNPLEEALQDNTQTPIPEQVSFRLDFPAWLLTQSHRDRRLIDGMLQGERTLDLARKHGVCPARISQKRREFHADWRRFVGDVD
jgi:hypothetical protein